MVRHLQNKGRAYPCPAALEVLAYAAQAKWLGQFGSNLEKEFGIDSMTLKPGTSCDFHWQATAELLPPAVALHSWERTYRHKEPQGQMLAISGHSRPARTTATLPPKADIRTAMSTRFTARVVFGAAGLGHALHSTGAVSRPSTVPCGGRSGCRSLDTADATFRAADRHPATGGYHIHRTRLTNYGCCFVAWDPLPKTCRR